MDNTHQCRIRSLEFTSNSVKPVVRDRDVASLPSLLSPSSDASLLGSIILVEDPTKKVFQTLVSSLNTNPVCYLSHAGIGRDILLCETVEENFLSFSYLCAVKLKNDHHPTRNLRLNANVIRKVTIEGGNIALEQHRCSVHLIQQHEKWLGTFSWTWSF